MRAFVAAAVLAVAVAGCSSDDPEAVTSESPSASASESSAPPALKNATTYTSQEYGFSFQYAPPFQEQSDTSWQAESEASATSSIAVFDVEGSQVGGQYRDAFVVNVYELNVEVSDANIESVKTELEQTVLPQLAQSSADMKISSLTPVEIAGLPGFAADADFTVEKTAIKSTLYFVFDGDIEYQLLTQASEENWDDLQPTFDAMLNSFTVGEQTAE